MIRNKLHEFMLSKLIEGMPYDLSNCGDNESIPVRFTFKELSRFMGFKSYREAELAYSSEIRRQFVLVPFIELYEFEQIFVYAGGYFSDSVCEFNFTRKFVIMYQAGLQALGKVKANDKK